MTDYESIVIFDTEWTAWPGSDERNWSGPGEYREVVQIGAVRLNRQYDEIEAIDLIVRPKYNPILSDYFIELTGISQHRLDREGRPFPAAMAQFAAFLTSYATVAYSNGADEDILRENLALNNMPQVLPDVPFLNIQPWLRDVLGEPTEFIPSHLFFCGADSPKTSPAHDALSDARTIAGAIRRLVLVGAPLLPHERPGPASTSTGLPTLYRKDVDDGNG